MRFRRIINTELWFPFLRAAEGFRQTIIIAEDSGIGNSDGSRLPTRDGLEGKNA
jgi:hypothetical protein